MALGGRAKLGFINGVIKAHEISSPNYEAWLCKDQLVMSWLLNSMERKIAEIFSYSNSSQHLWNQVKEMYGNQNNLARVFQLKRDVAALQQENKSFVQHLGNLTTMWNELDIYRPHTTYATVLLKRAEEDKIFQLLASLSSEYEDLRSHILMTSELPSFSSVCDTIQRKEVRRQVMGLDTKVVTREFRAYASNYQSLEVKVYKGKRPDLKCDHCLGIGYRGIGHTKDRCWILHPELKPKFNKDNKGPYKVAASSPYKVSHMANLVESTSNHVATKGC